MQSSSQLNNSQPSDLSQHKEKRKKTQKNPAAILNIERKEIDGFIKNNNIQHGLISAAFVAAETGKSEEFEKLYIENPGILELQDPNGQRLLHVATAHSHISIMAYILIQGGDMNAADNNGDTALHIAVKMRQTVAMEFLLYHDADSTILNKRGMSTLHLAAEMRAVDLIQILLENNVDVNLKASNGWTALHFAAIKDHLSGIKCLLKNGADLTIENNNHVNPVQLSAQHSATNTLDYLIKNPSIYNSFGLDDIKDVVKNEKALSLTIAICSGNLEDVRKCLKSGSAVNELQDDLSTPVHNACLQGKLEMLQIMYEHQKDNFLNALHVPDSQQMTPLHKAVLLNQPSVVDFLCDKGSDLNSRDSNGRTPLLLAAAKGHWEVVHLLLKKGANLSSKDKKKRNFLHLIVQNGAQVDQFHNSLKKYGKNLLNDQDQNGCTPLHYATKVGHLMNIDDLIQLGAIVNLKDNRDQSPFHFASRYGRYNTYRRLLDSSVDGHPILNEADSNGETPLHLAAQNGHTKLVSSMLREGAIISRNKDGNTPLHLAAENGYTQTVNLFLSLHPNIKDSVNNNNESPLHLAGLRGQTSTVSLLMSSRAEFMASKDEKTFFDYIIDNKHNDTAIAVVLHERWEEAMNLYSSSYGFPMVGLIRYLPEVAMAVLDRCQTPSQHHSKSRHYYIKFNFQYLQNPSWKVKEKQKQKQSCTPLISLVTMAKLGREDLLSHPVCENFLKMKWNAYGRWIYMFNLVMYSVFLGLLTNFVTTHDAMMHYDSNCMYALNITSFDDVIRDQKTREELSSCNFRVLQTFELSMFHGVTVWLIAVFSILNLLKELFQIIQQGRRYFQEPINILEWIVYTSSCIFIIPFLFRVSLHFQWEAGALAIFFAWFNLLVFLQRIEIFGLHVVMCLEVLRTLIQALCIYSILLIAFGMGFYVVMSKEESKAHRTPGLSILRVSMMILEPDFMDNFNDPYTDDDPYTLHFGNVSILLLAIFMLFTPIMLMNLLIGLAVGNIDAVIRNARLKKLTMQVELHADLEMKLPRKLLQKVNKVNYRVYPNKMSFINQDEDAGMLDSKLDSLGRSIAQSVYLYDELYQQKKRMKEITANLERHYDLLKLVVQKMEIQTEESQIDEGIDTGKENEGDSDTEVKGCSSDTIRNNLFRRIALRHWKKYKTIKDEAD